VQNIQDQIGNPAPIEPQNNVPNWAIAAFLLAIAAIAAVPVYRIVQHARQGTSSISSIPKTVTPAPAASLPAVVRRPQQPPPQLSDEDESRILALPLQQQAEELLQRSLAHDVRAREVLEQQLPQFKGVVRESPNMKQLMDRAQYSGDLRVRNVYCGLMLAMDGWNEDAQAVTMLVDRAKNENDSQQRAYDLWFIGLLGGRGVEPQQVHDVLLGYTQKDPDAYVRQWATEGLRFLGTDQALDDEFNIFVSDPSFTVRDRAGCNVSDCGNFTRKQRMRMLPKLLEIAEDPAANAQMRSWSFLAMQEITDVSLTPDAKAWRQWYTEHGAEKMAQFEKLPEWQVRGE